ncbi:hypothetical protein [Lentzea sp. NPDC051838]|uniref:hypothetical protein n=1 Tax=Lentzea sp. NPDC051838 TaxID=3154849 RepID=UPI00342C352B
MNIEEKLRGALDAPAPPPTTTLDVVLKRGRRRVFAQRAGAVLGVFAVVAGIGLGSTVLNHAAPDPSPADELPDGPATVVHELDWPRVNVPSQQPLGTWTPGSTAPPPPGRPVLSFPQCEMKQRFDRETTYFGGEEIPAKTVARYVDTARRLFPDITVGEPRLRKEGQQIRGVDIDLTDAQGTGSISITAGRLAGPPQTEADRDVWLTGDCQPPRRKVLGSGTTLQLYGVQPSEPFQSLTQLLTEYRAMEFGYTVQVELRNWGTPDLRRDPNQPDPNQPGSWERVGQGRATLPLTEEQFARLGLAVAEGA